MKQAIFVIALLFATTLVVSVQATSKKSKKTEMKNHVCTAACANGKCVFVHGEKGHTCTAACKTMDSTAEKMEMKEHVCNTSCTKDKCAIKHGEKGHVCTEACKVKM